MNRLMWKTCQAIRISQNLVTDTMEIAGEQIHKSENKNLSVFPRKYLQRTGFAFSTW